MYEYRFLRTPGDPRPFVSSREALDHLERLAPRGWCRHLLTQLSASGKLSVYAESQNATVSGIIDEDIYLDVRSLPDFQLFHKLNFSLSVKYQCEWLLQIHDSISELETNICFEQYEFLDWESGVVQTFPLDLKDINFGHLETGGDHMTFRALGLMFPSEEIDMLVPAGAGSKDLSVSTRNTKPLGRPVKHDWEGAIIAVAASANGLDGLPSGAGAQAEIESLMLSWFASSRESEPSESEVRKRASRICDVLGLKG